MSASTTSAPVDAAGAKMILHLGPLRMPVRRRSILIGLLASAALGVLGILALGMGSYPLTPQQVVETLLGGGDAMHRTVVIDWRLPRALAGITIGALLGLSLIHI